MCVRSVSGVCVQWWGVCSVSGGVCSSDGVHSGGVCAVSVWCVCSRDVCAQCQWDVCAVMGCVQS